MPHGFDLVPYRAGQPLPPVGHKQFGQVAWALALNPCEIPMKFSGFINLNEFRFHGPLECSSRGCSTVATFQALRESLVGF